ncbi:hypothetical protein, partial [Salmonella sp. s58953]|uniref:hypothetical protein n=1 Tax=Salmonella sp. s58953 TaxID=3159711 RepID=UPI00397F1ABB
KAQASSMKPSSLKGVFLLLALGLGLGLILAFMELSVKSRKIANVQQKSCCSVLTTELGQRFGKREATQADPSEKSIKA